MSVYCSASRSGFHSSGFHSMHNKYVSEDDLYRPAICKNCGGICFFNFATMWWSTRPYTIEEEPA